MFYNCQQFQCDVVTEKFEILKCVCVCVCECGKFRKFLHGAQGTKTDYSVFTFKWSALNGI